MKVASLVAGMVAGADCIDDMSLQRHGAMGKVCTNAYASSTLGSFLRAFTFGHVRQLDAVASRFLTGLAERAPLVATTIPDPVAAAHRMMLDLDDTIIEVHGHAKQGSGYGYSGGPRPQRPARRREYETDRPVVVAQRLRKGSCGSPRDAKRLVTDALSTVKKLPGRSDLRQLVLADRRSSATRLLRPHSRQARMSQ